MKTMIQRTLDRLMSLTDDEFHRQLAEHTDGPVARILEYSRALQSREMESDLFAGHEISHFDDGPEVMYGHAISHGVTPVAEWRVADHCDYGMIRAEIADVPRSVRDGDLSAPGIRVGMLFDSSYRVSKSLSEEDAGVLDRWIA